MRLGCIANWDSRKSLPTARIRLRELSIWSLNYERGVRIGIFEFFGDCRHEDFRTAALVLRSRSRAWFWSGQFSDSCANYSADIFRYSCADRRREELMAKLFLSKRCLWVGFFLLLASWAFAADGKSVSYKSGDETVEAALYTPEGKGPFPAIIVIHEWWGLNDWVKEQASKLADQGYETLAVDLYRGKIATTPEEAHEIMR